MAVFNQINDFLEYMVEAANLGSDTFTVALSDTAPGAEGTPPTGDGDGVLANVTEISYTNLSSRVITTNASSQASGTYKLVFTDLVLTASGGSVGPFRYIYIYDDTVTGDPLLGYWDYGSSITLNDGETLTLDFDPTNGVLQIS